MFNNVALVSLPRQDLIRPPAALPVLAGLCEHAGVDYSIWDFNIWLRNHCNDTLWDQIDSNWMKVDSYAAETEPWFSEFTAKLNVYIDQLLASRPDLVAISVFTAWSAHAALSMIKLIRQRSTVKIVIGGTGIVTRISFANDQHFCEYLLQQNLIDYYIFGEGEENFVRLLNGVTTSPGINNTELVQIKDLDSVPLSSYKKIDISQYHYQGTHSVMINGSRGCVRACTYCDVARYWPKFRFKSGNLLADEIFNTWRTIGVTSFEFSDSLINGSLREFRAMNRRLIELAQQHSEFKIEYKGQFICRDQKQFKESDYAEMKAAGCNYLYVGVETFSDAVRMSMDKKFDNDALDFHLQMSAKYGIPNVFLMIVGYPTETEHDHQLNLDGLYRYQRYSQAGVIEMITFGFTTDILEHTPLYEQKELLNIVDEFDDFNRLSNWISLKNPKLNYRERVRRWVELVETAYHLGYYQPRTNAVIQRLQQMLEITKHKSLNPVIMCKVD